MLMTTTPIIEGKRIVKYYGIVSGATDHSFYRNGPLSFL